MKVYTNKDGSLAPFKKKTIAVIGYGSQGHAQAQNLRDSGVNVIVGQRKGSDNYKLAVKHGFKPGVSLFTAAEAASKADFIQILLPDEVQAKIYETDILPHLTKGKTLIFSHGFNIHFKYIKPPKGVDVIMSAPKGPGHLVRSEFEKGGGVPGLIAVHQDASGKAKEKALAHAKGIGAIRGGVYETTFKEETETDLFGEQVVLCGGLSELIKSGFQTLVDAGLRPGDGLFRVRARSEADRGPDLPGRPLLHAPQHLQHRRVRRLHHRPQDRDRRHPQGHEEGIDRDPEGQVRQGLDGRGPRQRHEELPRQAGGRAQAPGGDRGQAVAQEHEVDRRQGNQLSGFRP
jgi:ketol-acid reductoisomerase